ncbi:hypothetical protein PV11_00070 [Exophiala sideris]|uniref:Uncharacterized protein n=1 Tax=Exophiala sideris TaxID=1016849 RepID=A0A0D1X8X8_9EURO|nr:hypothetical protein PV11_00070 [Exophiala sideris]
MNNPALPMYAPQNQGQYAFSNPQAGGAFPMSSAVPFDAAQTSFQPGIVPYNQQRASHPPPNQQHIPQPPCQQYPGQAGPYQQPDLHPHYNHQDRGRPSSGPSPAPVTYGTNQTFTPSQSQRSTPTPQAQSTSSAPNEMNVAANVGAPAQVNASLAQQAQIQNAAQMGRAITQPQQQAGGVPSLSPQSAARERARVSVLLEINTHLLQEVVSLQAQGKAGSTAGQGQQSPTSPTSATDATNALNNSPGDPPKSAGGPNSNSSKPASQEYADCMRRLQANLSYLAAIADAKKKATGALPSGPAIMVPPPQLPQVHDLYKKLNALFPEAGQSVVNKAVAYAAAQSQNQNQNSGTPSQQPASVSAQG